MMPGQVIRYGDSTRPFGVRKQFDRPARFAPSRLALPIPAAIFPANAERSDRAAVGPHVLAGDPSGVLGAEHRHYVRNVLRLPQPAQRGQLAQALLLLLGLALAE